MAVYLGQDTFELVAVIPTTKYNSFLQIKKPKLFLLDLEMTAKMNLFLINGEI